MCILVTYTRDDKNAVNLSPFQVKHVYRGATTNLPYVLALWKDVKSSFFTYFSCLMNVMFSVSLQALQLGSMLTRAKFIPIPV